MRYLLAFLLVIIIFGSTFGQRRKRLKDRFNVAASVGLNASQIDGDSQFGFTKGGFVGGLRGIINLTERTNFSAELYFSQVGSKPSERNRGRSTSFGRSVTPVTIDLHYAEVPLMLNHKVSMNEAGFYSVQLQVGFSYGRLLKLEIEEPVGANAKLLRFSQYEEDFNRDDINLKFGIAWFMIPKLSLGMRYSVSTTKLLNAEALEIDNPSLRSYYLGWHLAYFLNP